MTGTGQKTEEQLPDNIVPNDVKSIEGQWYTITTYFKIEKAKIDTIENPAPRHIPYKLTIKFPTEVRAGWYPRDITLTSEDERSYSNYGQGFDDSKSVKQLKQKLRDAKRYNFILARRNARLEQHFSKTSWEQKEEMWKKNRDKPECDYCGKEINMKKAIEGQDFIFMMEGEVIHLKCTPKMFNSICSECGICWSDSDDDSHCSECGGNLIPANEKEILKHCQYNAIQHYLPKELQDKIVFKKDLKF